MIDLQGCIHQCPALYRVFDQQLFGQPDVPDMME
jgi:hypothetical protein